MVILSKVSYYIAWDGAECKYERKSSRTENEAEMDRIGRWEKNSRATTDKAGTWMTKRTMNSPIEETSQPRTGRRAKAAANRPAGEPSMERKGQLG